MDKMTRQYALSRSSPSPQKDTDNWILQRTAVRSLPAKTLTAQTESAAGDRPGIKVDLMQIPLSNNSAKPSPLQAYATAHNSVAEETESQQVQQLATGRPVAQGVGRRGDRETPVQRQEEEKKAENKTGLPASLKEGIESMSGYDLSGVRVNYNSPKPAQLNAHAYTQGQAIEVAPGQERHLPHEAWHVVQQMQGRVRPTMEVNGVGVNGDRGLEQEADVMGQKALQMKSRAIVQQQRDKGVESVGNAHESGVQRMIEENTSAENTWPEKLVQIMNWREKKGETFSYGPNSDCIDLSNALVQWCNEDERKWGAEKVSERTAMLVNRGPILGDERDHNIGDEEVGYSWYFEEHHWIKLSGHEYDPLFNKVGHPEMDLETSSERVDEVLLRVFKSGRAVLWALEEIGMEEHILCENEESAKKYRVEKLPPYPDSDLSDIE